MRETEGKLMSLSTVAEPGSVQVAEELGRRLAVAQMKPQRPEGVQDAAPYIVLRDAAGTERVHELTKRLDPPHRKTGTVNLMDADSFIEYYKLHGNGSPVYAVMRPSAQFVAVLNDHTKEAAGYRDHRAKFSVAHSPEWDVWTKHNGSGAAFNSNEAFALFIEDNALDIVHPDASKMLQIALNFRVNAEVAFTAVQRLQDGQIDFGYSNVVNATAKGDGGNKLQIPEVFKLKIPVFAGIAQEKYEVQARFRYRLREGKLTLWYELVQPRRVVETAFKALWDGISKATKAPILHGTPE
ncbi:COG5532 Uncharacterized conserved protein [uncultured Caudovirales phage]|uniref:COG5532 Uncharacterized conserved protein n=1 Tax=uncultured Caudovirales phage TaxID=2100421 RepID=A0A6J5QA48_9CAUD|nr:COG5532 Uncharacterized conserved protein [uncultured Caudovirales phage]